jgi:hypothetical protein
VKRNRSIPSRICAYILLVSIASLGVCARLQAVAPAPPILWTVTNDDTGAPDVAPAPDGGVFVATTNSNSGGNIGAVMRLNSFGTQVWRQTQGTRQFHTVASDSAGNAYIGAAQNSLFHDAYLLKYSPTGSLQWTQTISSPLSDWPTGVAADSAGNAYYAEGPWASNYGTPPAGTYSTLRRFNPDGQLSWLLNLDTQDGTYPGNGAQSSNGTVIDHSGHVVSMFNNYSKDANNVIHSHAYLSKTSLDGQLLWIKSLGDLTNEFSIGVDSSDNVYAALNYSIMKFDSDGNQVWSLSNSFWAVSSLAVGPQNEIFVAGRADFSPYIAQYDANGNLIWSDIQPVGPDQIVKYSGLTVSGNKLIGSAWIAEQGVNSGNFIRAYQLVPEPASLFLATAFSSAMLLAARRRRDRTTKPRPLVAE